MPIAAVTLLLSGGLIPQRLPRRTDFGPWVVGQQYRQMIRERQSVDRSLRVGTLDKQMATNQIG